MFGGAGGGGGGVGITWLSSEVPFAPAQTPTLIRKE